MKLRMFRWVLCLLTNKHIICSNHLTTRYSTHFENYENSWTAVAMLENVFVSNITIFSCTRYSSCQCWFSFKNNFYSKPILNLFHDSGLLCWCPVNCLYPWCHSSTGRTFTGHLNMLVLVFQNLIWLHAENSSMSDKDQLWFPLVYF